MKRAKIKKKPEPKSEITRLMEVLEVLAEDTYNCPALGDIYAKIERATRHAKEVHDELLNLRDVWVDNEKLCKIVREFLEAVKAGFAIGKAKN